MKFIALGLVALAVGLGSARAEAPVAAPPPGPLSLSAVLGTATQPLASGLHWRIFNERAEADGSHVLIAESKDAQAVLTVAPGQYIVHVAYGLAGATRRVVVNGPKASERLVLNAGGLKIIGALGEKAIPASRLALSIFVPEKGNSEAKLVLANAKAEELIALPEGTYHIVSTYLDTVGVGSLGGPGSNNATNSVVAADLRVQTGKLTTATLRHRAAVSTLKLVNQPGGEALANTAFTVLTPGGDVIRELIGAFPSLVLAEGEYAAIARHEGKTYQSSFKVESTLDRDVEIIAK